MRAYKNLEQAERAFGSLKGPDLQIRPIHHHLEDRVRAHVLDLHARLLPHLAPQSRVETPAVHRRGPARQPRPRRQSRPLPRRRAKAQTKRTSTDQPAHSYRTLLAELATQTRNTTRLHGHTATFEKLTQPTALQAEALELVEHAPQSSIRRHDPNTPNHPKTKERTRFGYHQGELRIRANTRARVTIQHDSEDFGNAGVPRIP